MPDLILVDGGRGQVNAAEEVIKATRLKIPVLGLAKGLTRKNDYFVYCRDLSPEQCQALERIIKAYPQVFKRLRDEAHRFALKYHRQRRENVVF